MALIQSEILQFTQIIDCVKLISRLIFVYERVQLRTQNDVKVICCNFIVHSSP